MPHLAGLNILALSDKITYLPEYIETQVMSRMINMIDEKYNAQALDCIIQRLSKHLTNLEQSSLPIGEAKPEMLRRGNLTEINPRNLQKSKSNFVNCNKTIDALNKILFQQHLIKSNNKLLSNDDIIFFSKSLPKELISSR